MMHKYLEETALLDHSHPRLVALARERGWNELEPYDRIGSVYDFVRNEIRFGYNASDDLPASEVLADGYGQCNTKGTLLMALLRGAGVPCRFHGFTIDKKLQRGAVTGLPYLLAPRSIIHSWVEVFFDDTWVNLEGFILDDAYLDGVRCMFPDAKGAFCAYAIGTPNIRNPAVEWSGTDTYIQRTGIDYDYGIFDSPDEFYAKHGSNLSGPRRILYTWLVRHLMNATVARIRATRC
jgi:Transglutaminase-like superfamily